jgi:hypothetical protein
MFSALGPSALVGGWSYSRGSSLLDLSRSTNSGATSEEPSRNPSSDSAEALGAFDSLAPSTRAEYGHSRRAVGFQYGAPTLQRVEHTASPIKPREVAGAHVQAGGRSFERHLNSKVVGRLQFGDGPLRRRCSAVRRLGSAQQHLTERDEST